MRIKSFIKLFALSCFLFVGTAQAQTDAKYSEQSLLKAWEDNQRAQPTTKLFQKTKDKNIYLFETTLFPYKGKIVVHHVLIHDDIDYYGDYDAREASDKIGIIEAELIDAPERFRETLYRSISVWENQNTMYYFNDTEQWMTAAKWREKQTASETTQNNLGQCDYSKHSSEKKNIWISIIIALIGLSCLVYVSLSYGKYYKKMEVSLERQKKSLELQKEQTELLKQILAKKE